MKKPSTVVITSVLFLLAAAFGGYYYYKACNLQNELDLRLDKVSTLAEKEAASRELLAIDSMIATGDYKKALRTLNAELKKAPSGNKAALQLRLELAQKLINIQTAANSTQTELSDEHVSDTTTVIRSAQPIEIRRYDSLNFALEKANTQIKSLYRQLQQKSFGEYLTFNNSKGSEIYYVGQVRNKQANGAGVALLNTGSRYEGQWKNNMRHGEGTFYWPDGQSYAGHYKEDKRHGQGTYNWPNGDKYIGQWKNDQRNGQGTFYNKDGKVVASGRWKGDKLAEVLKGKE